ncbi:MAG: ammonium transporter [Opitutales bacterium]|nr:ammonium transporter [Opitutales bacterium]MCH8539923.1 ammonium transporter [Opitutales bacterium]
MKNWYKCLTRWSMLLGFVLAISAPASAIAEEEERSAAEIITAIEEMDLSPAAAAAVIVAEYGEDSEEAGFALGYLEMIEGHGEWAFAFDFFVVSMLWTVIAAALVFLMHLGFATLEIGLTRQKNAVNVLTKNVFIISIGIFTYFLIGFNTHYPLGDWIIPNVMGIGGPVGADDATFGYGGVGLAMSEYGDFIFQAMFAATAATIVSGAVAERIKLGSFFIFTVILVALAYPIVGSWHWGEGWLNQMDTPFWDFAGSSVVHGFGGFAALGAVLILGPRAGKYLAGGKLRPIPGHNLPLAGIGVFLLWFGWFGFNGGSVLSAEPSELGLVFSTTAISAASGALGAIFFSWALLKKPDVTMALNGVLAGLVGITAGADAVSIMVALFIGLFAGLLVVLSILFFDKIKIDDPVGAISVHGVVGIYGTVVIAFFNPEISFVTQLVGAVAVCATAFVIAVVLCLILKATIGLRVSQEEEEEGLDLAEHGQEAYPDFAKSSG